MVHEAQARVLIVADDLTGALDTAGPFAEQGLKTVVVAQPLDSDAEGVADARVVSINTASRHLGPESAAEQVERCVHRFARQRFNIVFKKVDSTLRGNVATETMALMHACGRRQALIAPAFPAQGRTVVNGVVHVDGVPLAETGFARDALSPPPLQPLGELFAQYVGAKQIGAWRHGEPLRFPEDGVVVADAGSDDDMSELFANVSGQCAQTLLVGSAGLGQILARNLGVAGRRKTEVAITSEPVLIEPVLIEPVSIEPVVNEPIVFVVGSRAARSREQVEQLRAGADTIVLEARNGVLAAATGVLAAAPGGLPEAITDLRTAKQIVVMAVPDPASGDADAVEVAARLAHAALAIAHDVGAGAMVVTGGDTAIAVLEASQCPTIQVGGNLMPGIPYARFTQNDRSIILVTKAGGFGTPDTMTEIVQCLRRGAASAPSVKV